MMISNWKNPLERGAIKIYVLHLADWDIIQVSDTIMPSKDKGSERLLEK